MGPVCDSKSKGCLLSVDDCRCPVCLEIFMEPVTLPCSHTFCKNCFLESVDKATLSCPMCRKRVSTWARHSNRNNTLVNQKLWMQIQTCFPLQCQRRMCGQEDVDDTVSVCFPRVSEPGEIRQEYEDQVTKLTEEKRVMDEEERKASEEFIQKMLAEEHELLQQEIKRSEEDERLAQQLSSQLNSGPPSQEMICSAATPVKKNKEVGSGHIERYLCPLPSKTSSQKFNKENDILSQVKEGPQLTSLHTEYQSICNQLITEGQTSSSKRNSSVLEEEKLVFTKRGCPSSSPELSSSVLHCEKELLSRQRQEEEDRHLAMLLQKKLNEEERQRSTDRRKGSADAYLLRQKRKSKLQGTTPGGVLRRFSNTSTSSDSSAASASPSSSKQTTLTELFSTLRS